MKVKVKFILEQATKAQRGSRCIGALSLILALEVGEWSKSCPVHFTPRKDPVLIVYEAG